MAVSAAPALAANLDPSDWDAFRTRAHSLLHEVLDHLQSVGSGPVWQPVPEAVLRATRRPLPRKPAGGDEVAHELTELLLPHGVGNSHPRFFGWVHGAGTPGGVLAELVAAAVNTNCGGRDHAAIYFERQVLQWVREIFGFPESSSGLLVSGTSMANLVCVQAARTAASPQARASGLAAAYAARQSRGLVGYASSAVHGCLEKAFGISGLGTSALRRLSVDSEGRLDPQRLDAAIVQDRRDGFQPFLVIATAGTADIGAMDDLMVLGAVARRHRLWFHVDGAFGALAILSPAHRHLVAGIERADSLAFDFHKWAHVPYDAGCVLIRDEAVHRRTFAMEPAYLERGERGTAAGAPWFCDYGPELSRGARAVKVWATLCEQGLDRIGAAIASNCTLALELARRLQWEPEFELLAPVALNIVCFRHRPPGVQGEALDRHNRDLACDLQESGAAVVSTTRVGKALALRAAIVNHRTTPADIEILVQSLARLARGPAPVNARQRRSASL